MARSSFGEGLGKGAVGFGFGFGLYFLLRHLSFRSGFSFDGAGRKGRPGEVPLGPAPGLPQTQVPAPQPKDELPLLFWMFNPAGFKGPSKSPDPVSRARADARFLQLDFGKEEVALDVFRARVSALLRSKPDYKGSPAMTIDDVISRVQAGGRNDVRLMTSGATVEGTWKDVKDALMGAGIKHWELWEEAPADRKSGAPPKPPRWNLFAKGTAADLNPDKKGHYHFENVGTAYWNLSRGEKSTHHVGGMGLRGWRGLGRGCYR